MAIGEWDQRQLCPDGGCIGVIGPDGTCKVCGHVAPNWGDERNRGLLDPPADDEDAAEDEDDRGLATDDDDGDHDEGDDDEDDEDGDDPDDGDDEPDDDGDGAHRVAGPGGEWTVRTLCPDGGCIGVIGADGRCKACGRSATGAVAEPPASVVAAAEVVPAGPAAPAVATGEPRDDEGAS